MKCKDCTFYQHEGFNEYRQEDWGCCMIELPPMAKNKWGDSTPTVYESEGCSLGQSKEQHDEANS